MKKIFTFILALTASAGTLFAQSGTCGTNLTWNLSGGTLTISGTGAMADFDSDDPSWTSYLSSIQSVVIETGATSIGNKAFYGCSSMTSVTIPNTVTSIGSNAFNGCTGLLSVTISHSIESIGANAFRECTGLASIAIGTGLTSIGESAFYQCSSLTSITVASGNTTFDSREDCNAIIKTETNTLIAGCKNTVIPGSVTSIGANAFAYCTGLTAVTIPNSVTSIGQSAFAYSALTSVTIPNAVTSIGNYAFQGCTGLTSVTIGFGVESIGMRAFRNCTNLASITCDAITPPTCGDDCFGNVTKSIPVYVPQIKVATYQAAAKWSDFSNILAIPAVASGNCGAEGDNLKWWLHSSGRLTISGTGNMASWTTSSDEPWYSHQSDIKSVVIEAGATSIGNSAFDRCSNLTSVIIPEGVTSIGEGAFWFTALTSVTIPNSVMTIGNSAFNSVTSLTSVTIPDNVTYIGNLAFYGCNLTSIAIPSYVTHIGENAFKCDNLISITVESGNTTFDSRNNCNAIIVTANDSLIRGCKNTLIPNSVTKIGGSAFRGCTGLTSVTIPNSVTSIGGYAFSGCTGLTAITCKATTPPTCSTYAPFSGVNMSIPLYVPAGTLAAYQNANVWSEFTNIQEESATGIDNTAADNGATKRLVNGQIFIEKNGKTYTVTGQEVR